MSKSTFKGWRLCINCTEKGQKANLNQKGGQSLRVRNCLTIQFHVTDMINRIWKNNIFKYLLVSVTESANLQKWNSGETEYFSCQRCFLFLSWGVTGNTKGWQENLQWLAPFDTGIASYVPYSAKLLCTTSSFFTRCLWGQPRPVPSSAPAAYQLFWWMTVSEHSDHIELELLLRPFSVGLSSNALPL